MRTLIGLFRGEQINYNVGPIETLRGRLNEVLISVKVDVVFRETM